MRQRELLDGIIVTDEEGNDLAKSKVTGSGCCSPALSVLCADTGGSTGWYLSGDTVKDCHCYPHYE